MEKKERICPVCKSNKVLSTGHRKKCFGNNPNYKIEYIKYNNPSICEEVLCELYLELKWSIPMIGEKFNLDNKSVCFLLRYYNIQIRTIKETRHLSEYKNRIEKTNLERYGAVNPLSKGTEPFNKRNKTVIDRYGCENVWQRLDLFIDDWNNLGKHSKISSLNKKLYTILNEINIEYTPEFGVKYISEDGKRRWKSYDAKIGDLLIEINGDYWHANPNKYNSETIFYFPGSIISAKEIWDLDKQKEHIAIANGYKLLVIWEDEIKNNIEDVKQKIKNCLNNKN